MAQTARVDASNGGANSRRLQLTNKEPVSNTEHRNHHFTFPRAGKDFFLDPYIRENGSNSPVASQNQGILEELRDYIRGSEHYPADNNNKGNSVPNKMATSSTSGSNQATVNANGFEMTMNSSPGLANKSRAATTLGSAHLNNQLSSILGPGSSAVNAVVSSRNLSQSNSNPTNLKLLATNQPSVTPQDRFNRYNPRQEMLLHGFREVPIAPRAPNVSEQYGSQQGFVSAQSENQQKRGLNPQTPSPYSPAYYGQDSSTSQTGQRTVNSQPDDRNMITNQQFQWQNRLQTSNHCSSNLPTNSSPGPPMGRTQLQSGIPQQQSPYMMMGNSQQQSQSQQTPPPSYPPYMMQQGGMKAAGMPPQSQQYYGSMAMGRPTVGQPNLAGQVAQRMGGQMPKPSQDYSGFQQQQMQHRYPQPQFPQQMQFMTQPQPRQQQQQQQSYPQPPTGMPRMPSSHPQPILPKPASGDMFGRYSTNNTSENLPGQEFGSSRMAEHPQHAMPSTPASYGNPPLGRMGSSSEMLSKYGSTQGGYSRGNPPPFPGSIHARHTPSPNVTLGSPLRNVPDGTSPSVGMPNFGQDSPTSTGSMPTYPPGKLAPPFVMPANQMSATNSSLPSVSVGGSGLGGPGAAAVAGVLEGVNSGARFPSPAQVSGSPYVSPQEMIMGSKVSENTTPSGMSPMQLGSMMGNVQTGRVPSPTLNELPTAEDVEAMIESMRAGETSLPTDNGEQPPLQGSAPPSVSSLPPTMESSPSRQQVSTAHGQNSSGETQQHSSNSNLDMSAMIKEDQSGSPQTSPLSTFSGLSPGVSPSGVSITSSFDDLDEINPSLPNNPISMSSYQFPSPREPQQQYEKFSKLYEVSDELERKEFLDKYQAFMNSQGTQITQVPAFQRQPLDLYKFYTAVRERGGVQEVVRRKLWQDVLEELNLPTDSPSIVNVLRIQYSRYLLSYEMKHTKTNSLDDIKINLLEGSGIPPPNATVTCSEAIIPTSSLTQSQRPADASSVHASHGSMKIESSAGLPAGYNSRDGFAEPGFDNSNLFPDLRDMTGNFQLNQSTSSNTFGMPQYPYSGDNRRHSVPNLPQGALPSYMMSQRNMYPNPSSMSPFFQQSSSQTGHPPAANYHHSQYQQRASPSFMGPPSSPHSMIPNASPQEKVHPSWGSQYSPSTEPEHMVDYPPGAHSLRSPRLSSSHQPQFPPAPPYGSYPSRQQGPYSAATPPYRPIASPSPSSRQQAMAQSMQAAQKAKYQHQQQLQSQQQQQQPQAHTAAIKRDATFPPDCVEASRPVFTKKRKLTSRDLGPVEAWRVMMSLKSGLLSEATWALDTLNILLYDDNTVTYFMLAQLPGLLDNLIDHFRRYLVEIFDTFGESEIDVGTKVVEQRKEGEREGVKGSRLEEGQLEIEKVNLNAKRSFTAVLVGSTFEFSKEGFQSGASDWLMGGGDTTLHIQTHIGSMPGRDFVESSELKGVERRNNTTDIKKETDNTRFSELEESEAFCEDVFCSGRKKCLSNCGDLKPFSTCPAFKEDFDSKTEVSVKRKESSTKALEAEKSGDTCGSQQEELFTKRLKKELDLDFDSETEDSESDRYIQTEVVSKINVKRDPVIEEQSCGKEDAPLCLRTESQDAVSRRCLCVSNILRGLSFVPGNDAEMSRHAGLLLIVGRLLLLHHQHAKRVPYRHSYLQDEVELECPSDDRQDWWWYCLEGLRENALVITANVAGQLDLSLYPEAISAPLLDGLLHWFVCPSAAAQDPMPTATPGTSLSPRQLALEALAKMSILESNVDMMLSSPPLTRVEELYAMLVRLVGERGNPVTRELALVLLSNLAQGENSFVGFGDSKACISMLLEFIEDAATNMSAYSSGSALAQAGFHSENFCGTSVDMLRRAASTLVCLARIRSNRALFLPFQQRVLRLAIMRILDNMITSQLAEILFYLSR